jgi:hypothetical protein
MVKSVSRNTGAPVDLSSGVVGATEGTEADYTEVTEW